jgi:hypothetical protein
LPSEAELLPGLNPEPSVQPGERAEALAGLEGLIPTSAGEEGLRVVLEADGKTPVAGLTLVFFGLDGDDQSAKLAERWLNTALKSCLEGGLLPAGPNVQAFLGTTDRNGLLLLPEQALAKFRRGMLIGASRAAYLPRTSVDFGAPTTPAPKLLAQSLAAVQLELRFPGEAAAFPRPGVAAFQLQGAKAPLLKWSHEKGRVKPMNDLLDSLFPQSANWEAVGGRFRMLFAFVGPGAEAKADASSAPSSAKVSVSVALPGYGPASLEIPLVATGSPLQASIDLVSNGAPLGELVVRFSPPPALSNQRHNAPSFLATLSDVTDEKRVGRSYLMLHQGSVAIAGIPPGRYGLVLDAFESGLEFDLGLVEITGGAQTSVNVPEHSFAWVIVDPSQIGFQPDRPEVTLSIQGRQVPEDWSTQRTLNCGPFWYPQWPTICLVQPGPEYRLLLDPPLFYDASLPAPAPQTPDSPFPPIELGLLQGGQSRLVELR